MIKVGSIVRLITPIWSVDQLLSRLGVVINIENDSHKTIIGVRFVNRHHCHVTYYMYEDKLLEVS